MCMNESIILSVRGGGGGWVVLMVGFVFVIFLIISTNY